MSCDLSRRAATATTEPCSNTTGTPVTQLAGLMFPRRIAEAIAARAELGRQKYGTELRAPWTPGTREAWQEILDGLAYLLASGDEDDAVFAHRLAAQADAWARQRGLYTGHHDV